MRPGPDRSVGMRCSGIVIAVGTSPVTAVGWPWSWRPPAPVATAAMAVLAAGIAVIACLEVTHFEPPPRHPWTDFALAAVVTLPLAAAHRRAAAVFTVIIAGDAVIWLLRPSWTAMGAIALAIAVYAVAAERGRRAAALAWGLCATGIGGTTLLLEPVYFTDGTWIVVLLLCLVSALAGDAVHARRRWHEHVASTGRRRAALEERIRLSRELHDIVAHHLTAIAVQADTAPRRRPDLPPAAAEDFAVLGDTARTALEETRQLIAFLRSEDTDRRAAPGVDQLPSLVEEAARDGLVIDSRWSGDRTPLPEVVGLAVFRVAQEALTNVRRHSGARTARIDIERRPETVTVRITDPGPTTVPHGAAPGFGLTGLHERVSALDGDLHAGPRDGGGFEVQAHLPLPPTGART
jgi:signal transduction histidine kinase